MIKKQKDKKRQQKLIIIQKKAIKSQKYIIKYMKNIEDKQI